MNEQITHAAEAYMQHLITVARIAYEKKMGKPPKGTADDLWINGYCTALADSNVYDPLTLKLRHAETI